MTIIGSDLSGQDTEFTAISVIPCSPNIGAEIGSIDLTRPLSNRSTEELREAFIKYQVIFFRDQKITFEDHVRLAEYF